MEGGQQPSKGACRADGPADSRLKGRPEAAATAGTGLKPSHPQGRWCGDQLATENTITPQQTRVPTRGAVSALRGGLRLQGGSSALVDGQRSLAGKAKGRSTGAVGFPMQT